LLAFVSNHGVHVTDGYSFDTWTDGLAWRDIVPIPESVGSVIALINNPEAQEVRLLVGSYISRELGLSSSLALAAGASFHFNYSSDHLVNGKPKISGPVAMANYPTVLDTPGIPKSIWPVQDNGLYSVYVGYGGTGLSATANGAGQAYVEGGSNLPVDDPNMVFGTRVIYPASPGNEFKLDQIHNLARIQPSSPSDTATFTYTAYTSKTNQVGEATKAVASRSVGSGLRAAWFHRVPMRQVAEGLRLFVSVSGAPQGTVLDEYLILEGDGLGVEDSGK
jgi:hypothetical protein